MFSLTIVGARVPDSVTLGTFSDQKQLVAALQIGGFNFEYMPIDYEHMPLLLADNKKSLRLKGLTADDLGLDAGATLADAYATALGQGLELCPAEVGPQLLLQHRVSEGTYDILDIAMEPVPHPLYPLDAIFRVVLKSPGRLHWRGGDPADRAVLPHQLTPQKELPTPIVRSLPTFVFIEP